MGTVRTPLPVKLFVAMLSSDAALFAGCLAVLAKQYGPVDHHSEIRPWTTTDYYNEEMGTGLLRSFAFFGALAEPDVLPGMKLLSVELEDRFSLLVSGKRSRRINIDPGYLTEAKVLLSTTKDYSHRVYIGRGIYAEATLQFRGGRYRETETTYPDYRSDETIELFMNMRERLRTRLHEHR